MDFLKRRSKNEKLLAESLKRNAGVR